MDIGEILSFLRHCVPVLFFETEYLGLNSNRSPNLVSAQQWMWVCAFAYWQLLLMREVVNEDYPAWYPHNRRQRTKLTPYQVQHSAFNVRFEIAHLPCAALSLYTQVFTAQYNNKYLQQL